MGKEQQLNPYEHKDFAVFHKKSKIILKVKIEDVNKKLKLLRWDRDM